MDNIYLIERSLVSVLDIGNADTDFVAAFEAALLA